ncbi:T9SS type A sorting domain-containing protein, partial [Phaeodactylibacter xiamenensis]
SVECNYLTIDDFSLEYAVNTEELILNRIEVFPNPFSDKVRIRSERGIEKIVVSDLSGRMILSETTFDITKELDLSGFDSGVLILTIIDEEGIKNNYKLIKMN